MPRHSFGPKLDPAEHTESQQPVTEGVYKERIGNKAKRALEPASRRIRSIRAAASAQVDAIEATPTHFIHAFSTVAVALLIVAFTIPQCASSAVANDRQVAASQTHEALASLASEQGFALGEMLSQSRSHLTDLIGEEYADRLIDRAGESSDAAWIATHVDDYGFAGEEVQAKVLKLAVDDPVSLPFIRELPSTYPADGQKDDATLALSESSPSDTVPDTNVPHLYQWDRRWGFTAYSSAPFGLSGCGPTSLAMVYRALTDDDSKTPYDLGLIAQEGGYMQEFDGTDNDFFTESAYDLGLYCKTLYPDSSYITSELEAGHVIITNFTPGYFTQFGHFAVLAGLTGDGQVIMNDPYSVERSSQTWDPEFIAQESRVMYVYSPMASEDALEYDSDYESDYYSDYGWDYDWDYGWDWDW